MQALSLIFLKFFFSFQMILDVYLIGKGWYVKVTAISKSLETKFLISFFVIQIIVQWSMLKKCKTAFIRKNIEWRITYGRNI